MAGSFVELAQRLQFCESDLRALQHSPDHSQTWQRLLAKPSTDAVVRELSCAFRRKEREEGGPPYMERESRLTRAQSWKQKGDHAYGQWLVAEQRKQQLTVGHSATLLQQALHHYTEVGICLSSPRSPLLSSLSSPLLSSPFGTQPNDYLPHCLPGHLQWQSNRT